MNRFMDLEKARAEVAVRKAQMAEIYDSANGWQPMLQIFGCHNFHQACTELREAEARLRKLEALDASDRQAANDTRKAAV